MSEPETKPTAGLTPLRIDPLITFLRGLKRKIEEQDYYGDEKPKAKPAPIRNRKPYPRKQARLARENRRRYEQLGAEVGPDPIGTARDALGRRRWMTKDEFGAALAYGFLAVVCERMNIDLRDVLRQISRKGEHTVNAQWRAASLARRFACYLTRIEGTVELKPIARAFDITPPSVCIGCREIEKLRDDAQVDKLIDDAAEILLRGATIPVDDRWIALKPKQSRELNASQQR